VHVACLRAGLVVVPVNGDYREAELAHLVGDCAPRAALVDEQKSRFDYVIPVEAGVPTGGPRRCHDLQGSGPACDSVQDRRLTGARP